MQWMLNLSLADQTTKSQSLWHQEFRQEKDLQKSESHHLPYWEGQGEGKQHLLGPEARPCLRLWQFLSNFAFSSMVWEALKRHTKSKHQISGYTLISMPFLCNWLCSSWLINLPYNQFYPLLRTVLWCRTRWLWEEGARNQPRVWNRSVCSSFWMFLLWSWRKTEFWFRAPQSGGFDPCI